MQKVLLYISLVMLFCCKPFTYGSAPGEDNVVLKSGELKKAIDGYLEYGFDYDRHLTPDKVYLVLFFERTRDKVKLGISSAMSFGYQSYDGHFGMCHYNEYKVYLYGDVINELLKVDETKPVREYEVEGPLFDYDPYYWDVGFDENYNVVSVHDFRGDIDL